MAAEKKKTHMRDLQLTLPVGDKDTGPCTPTYEFPVSLPQPRNSPCTPDVSGLNLGQAPTPSPTVTGKRTREDEWDPQEVEVLQNVLNRPPKEALFAPGSMPPPHVLDELTSAVVEQLGPGREVGATGDVEEAVSGSTAYRSTDDPMDDTSTEASVSCSTSRTGSPDPEPSSHPAAPWPHSWDETRRMLTTLALADTRLGAERADRKLTRQERLARRSLRRADSMDFLDRDGSETPPSEKLGRALRLSTKLQNSAREVPNIARTASLGAPATTSTRSTPAASTSAASHSTPPVSFNRSFGRNLTPSTSNVRPAPMRRNSSNRSDRSDGPKRRPSLLARGRSFTASDLEAEFEAEEAYEQSMRHVVSAPISNVPSSLNMAISPKTPTNGLPTTSTLGLEGIQTPSARPDTSETDESPRRRSSAPDMASTRLLRSHSYSVSSRREQRYDTRGTSQDYSRRGRDALGLGLPPAPTHAAPSALGAAFSPSQPAAGGSGSGEWDSDSDREGIVSVKRRARRPHLVMTAMSRQGDAAGTETPPKLVIDPEMDPDGPALRSPFEERPMPLS